MLKFCTGQSQGLIWHHTSSQRIHKVSLPHVRSVSSPPSSTMSINSYSRRLDLVLSGLSEHPYSPSGSLWCGQPPHSTRWYALWWHTVTLSVSSDVIYNSSSDVTSVFVGMSVSPPRASQNFISLTLKINSSICWQAGYRCPLPMWSSILRLFDLLDTQHYQSAICWSWRGCRRFSTPRHLYWFVFDWDRAQVGLPTPDEGQISVEQSRNWFFERLSAHFLVKRPW